VGGWGNSSSKAFGISFADRPKAKTMILNRLRMYKSCVAQF
jgi:hypothetical protein